MINAIFIEKRLELILKYYKDLENLIIDDIKLAEFKKDVIRYYALERVFQLIVDEMIDINNHIISHSGFETADDFQSTFTILAEKKILPENFTVRIAPTVGLRNRLVHRYEAIDKNLVVKMAYTEKYDFREYVKFIREYLKNNK